MSKESVYEHILNHNGKVTTDTRKIQKGDIFFALKGPNFNGNFYAEEAIKKGCAFAVVDEMHQGQSEKIVFVDNVLVFLQKLAKEYRKTIDIPLIAIGGSNGKTTTKELLSRVLSTKFKVHKTIKNFNNHIGVPLTLLSMPKDTEIAIVELGTNSPGEIAHLCKITEPNFGLITNIGKEHLAGFGSLENVAKEESELFLWLHKNNGIAFVDGENKWLVRMSKSLKNRVVFPDDFSWQIENVQLMPSITFDLNQVLFKSHLMGDYNFSNIKSAMGIGSYFKVSLQQMQEAIESFKPKDKRSQWTTWKDNKILLDCYNANPSSMELAIQNFSKIKEEKMLILGDMFELGKFETDEHQSIVNLCIDLHFNDVILIGNRFGRCRHNFTHYSNTEELDLSKLNIHNKHILIKGSRSMQLESLINF